MCAWRRCYFQLPRQRVLGQRRSAASPPGGSSQEGGEDAQPERKRAVGPYSGFRAPGPLSNPHAGERLPYWREQADREWLRGTYSLYVLGQVLGTWMGLFALAWVLIDFTALPDMLPKVRIREAVNDDLERVKLRCLYTKVAQEHWQDFYRHQLGRPPKYPDTWAAYLASRSVTE
eukprot:TRINITY_DN52420_c0_g1_i1.p1 TRINITY_DN52420_c0_g1~~TRINITY_DN52420_c0_g1_i1.p1  ORF type:complete len:200 (+),score=34.68 TRINITY_DN52420_c0_g1_i1:77-601(+)